MHKLLIVLICCFPLILFGQTPNSEKLQSDEASISWLTELAEKGYNIKDDSVIISKEFHRILQDSTYRKLLYPKNYTWTQTSNLIKNQQLKPAFWYMINLYPKSEKDKKMAVRSVLAYEKVFKMDEVLLNTFYTYSFMDPEVSEVKNGIPEITRPDIMETKLKNVKEIVEYIYIYRKQQKEKPANK